MNRTAHGPGSGNWSAGAKVMGGGGERSSLYLVSRTTPTISYSVSGYPGSAFVRITLPMGFAPAAYFLTNASFTTATFGDARVSRSVKSRPASKGISMVWKYPGLTQVNRVWPSAVFT